MQSKKKEKSDVYALVLKTDEKLLNTQEEWKVIRALGISWGSFYDSDFTHI